MEESYQFKSIGIVHSCFKERFGIPRQPGLVTAARGWIEFYSPYDREEAFEGLESFSHLWITFLFHQSLNNQPGFVVRPPRSSGRRNLGVYATRAPNRPNQIGQSVVALEKIEVERGKVKLHLRGVDMVEGTPVLDIKPYLPYADNVLQAHGSYAHTAPDKVINVVFASSVNEELKLFNSGYPDLQQLIVEVLQYDPRPIYYRGGDQKSEFSVNLYDLEVCWQMLNEQNAHVIAIKKVVE
ncbi:tRNA (N6-threonylcarbamoyladenosine(37)-N6)-methyltransferase TrmO [Pseudomonadota bacterium]